MKLRNKKTGEIIEICKICPEPFEARDFDCNSLAELNEEWEDYEEPKDYWFIDYDGGIIPFSKMKETATDRMMKQVGNYFNTREEAEKAVEKLKAWKRLKDKGFRFKTWYGGSKNIDWEITSLENETYIPRQICDDLDLLFGGEE